MLLNAKSYNSFVDSSSDRLRGMSALCDFNNSQFPAKNDSKLRPLQLNLGKAIQFLTNIKIEQKRKEGEDPSPDNRLGRRISSAQKFAARAPLVPPDVTVRATGSIPPGNSSNAQPQGASRFGGTVKALVLNNQTTTTFASPLSTTSKGTPF